MASIGVVGNVLVVFFLAIFISIDRAAIGSFLLRLVPPAYSEEAHLLSESVGRSFGGFMRGMVVIGGLVRSRGALLQRRPRPELRGDHDGRESGS